MQELRACAGHVGGGAQYGKDRLRDAGGTQFISC